MANAPRVFCLQGPDGYPRKVKVADNGDGTFKATYTPDDLGQYKVNVKYGGKEVPHAPFTVQAQPTGRADSCKITEGIQQQLSIGEEYCISVNAQNAGNGAVTCRIRSTSGRSVGSCLAFKVSLISQFPTIETTSWWFYSDMDIDIEDNGDGTFSIYYTVKDAGEYTLSIKFGGQPVPEGVYNFTVSPTTVSLSRIIVKLWGRWDRATQKKKEKKLNQSHKVLWHNVVALVMMDRIRNR